MLAKHVYASSASADMGSAMELLLDRHITPMVSKTNQGEVRLALHSEEIHRFLPHVAPSLMDAFRHYSAAATNQTVLENRWVISTAELAMLLSHAGLLPSADDADQAALREARRLFGVVQHYEPSPGTAPLKRVGDDLCMNEMVFQEVLEAAGAVGMDRFSAEPGMGNIDRVRRALSLVARLGEAPGTALSDKDIAEALADADTWLVHARGRAAAGAGSGAGGATSAAGLSDMA